MHETEKPGISVSQVCRRHGVATSMVFRWSRRDAVGLVKGDMFEVPFAQANLADTCGPSTVHVNRTMQELRYRGLISWRGGTVAMLDRAALEAVAEFEASYLHLGHK